jgi:RimJ/RimL family protein N-acetyltransferase
VDEKMAVEPYTIRLVDGMEHADLLHHMNGLDPQQFLPLKSKHLSHGVWWIVQIPDGTVVGFSGLVPMAPFHNCGYFKRVYVLPEHRGHGLGLDCLKLVIETAKQIGLTQLVTECCNNPPSEANIRKAGFVEVTPDRPWGEEGTLYFSMML